jgi:hypothetical protein
VSGENSLSALSIVDLHEFSADVANACSRFMMVPLFVVILMRVTGARKRFS